jgi:hypothetical protein
MMIMKKSTRVASLAIAVPAAVLAMAGVAQASGTYTFAADFKYRLDTGSWDQNSGTTTFYFTCTSGGGQQYSATMWKNSIWGDDNKGSHTFTCDGTQDVGGWSLASGKYHITLSKADNGVRVIGSGKVTYP